MTDVNFSLALVNQISTITPCAKIEFDFNNSVKTFLQGLGVRYYFLIIVLNVFFILIYLKGDAELKNPTIKFLWEAFESFVLIYSLLMTGHYFYYLLH